MSRQNKACQFQPSEFSAIMGADICWLRALVPPLRPLPRLPRLSRPPPGVKRPPNGGDGRSIGNKPPAISGPLAKALSLSASELDRWWRCFRCLYLRAMSTIAAPYTTAPATTPKLTAMVVLFNLVPGVVLPPNADPSAPGLE